MNNKKQLIRLERHYSDGSVEYTDKESTENFESNLSSVGGLIASRSSIQMKPVEWQETKAENLPTSDDIMEEPTEKYRYCNHHHKIGDSHELVNFGDGEFVANKEAIPLLKALNEIGLRTRSHHIDDKEYAWVCILLDNAEIEVKEVFERDADRTKYNGKKELLIRWRK